MTTSTGRRGFLGWMAAGAVLPAWRGWTGSGTAGHIQEFSWEEALDAAVAGARLAGKPLLAIRVPSDQAAREAYGRLWGAYLAGASDERMAELAMAEVVCVGSQVLARRFPSQATALEAGAPALWIETDGVKLEATVIEGQPYDELLSPNLFGHDGASRYEAVMESLVEPLARRVRAALLPGPEGLARRVDQMSSSGRQMQLWTLFEDLQQSVRPKLTHADEVAALVHAELAKPTGPGASQRERLIEVLAAAAANRLWEQDPVGARWTHHTNWCPPCGMGHVPEVARHFLGFLTAKEDRK